MADDIRVKFTADGSSYTKQLKELTQQNKTLKSEVDKVKSSTDQNTTAQEKAAKVAEAVQKQVKGQEEYIKALKAEYEKLSQAEGDNSTELLKQEEKINKAEAALNKMNGELADAQREADGYGDETAEATKQTQEMDEAARLLAASKLADFYNAVSEAVQKVASAAYDAAKELDAGYDTIVKKTGATGDELGKLSESADAVFGRLPVEMADVGTAIGEVNTRFGLTGDELENVSELFLKFANVTDTDVNTAIGTTSRLLKTYGGNIKDTDKVLGYFAKQSQLTGVDTNTLMSSLDRNGATLREMGLDLQQSTRLLATFEANGVDSTAAMTGMRKAIVEGAKQGKSFDQVIREASDGIKNATTDAEALQIATELFGTRGAVVMADGLRDGKISLDDLSESMESYGSVVGDTFEATLSPWDQSKIAMNNLKTAGKELANEALATIAPLLEQVVEIAKAGVKWFKNLPAPVKKVVAVIGLLGAGAGVAFPKVQSLFQTLSMFKAANAIKGLTGTSDAAKGLAGNAGKAGSAMAFLTNPVTLGTAAVSALGLALVGLAKHSEDMIQAEYGLTEAQKAEIAVTEENYTAMQEMAAARQEAVNAAQAEYGHIEDLAHEYDTLIDANGRVKKGYEDRANFILGELAKATGQTIDQIRAEIDENGKLKQSIYDTIAAKKAEAVLSASQAAYTDAIQKQAAAQQDYANKVALAAEREREYKAAIGGTNGVVLKNIENMRAQLATMDPLSNEYADLATKIGEYETANFEVIRAEQVARESWNQSKTAVEQAGATLGQYNSTIKNYETLAEAIASGSTPKIQSALENVTRSFQTAETGTKQSLEAQLANAKNNLSAMEKAFSNGAVDRAAVDMARKLVIDSRRELNKLDKVGKDSASGLQKGLKAGELAVGTQGKALGQTAVKQAAVGAETASPSRATMRTGKDVGQGLVAGMSQSEGSVRTGGTRLGQAATGGVSSGASVSSARSAGTNLGQGLADGIWAKNGTVSSWAESVAWNAAQKMRRYNDSHSAGAYMGQGLADGINSKARDINAAASNVSNIAIRTMRNIPQISSPSKVTTKIGAYIAEGLAKGMEQVAPVKKAAAALAQAAITPSLALESMGGGGSVSNHNLTYGDIVVNVSGANVSNEDALARKISDTIFRQVKAQKAVFA